MFVLFSIFLISGQYTRPISGVGNPEETLRMASPSVWHRNACIDKSYVQSDKCDQCNQIYDVKLYLQSRFSCLPIDNIILIVTDRDT